MSLHPAAAPDTPTAGSRVLDLPRDREPDTTSPAGSRTWALRGRNAVVLVTDLVAGDLVEEHDLPDEYALLVDEQGPADGEVTVHHAGAGTTTITAPAFVVIPAGTSSVVASTSRTIVRVFSTWCVHPTALAGRGTRTLDPRTTPLGTPRPVATAVGVHPLRDVPNEPGRLGRIFRTASLMINWFPDHQGPRDTEALTPHAHEDFEQISVTLHGDYVHHLRTPWTARMSRWRDDEHVSVPSPSMLLMPPTLIHTTAAVGPGRHSLVDVFAPPREDFLAHGWVLNAADYDDHEAHAYGGQV